MSFPGVHREIVEMLRREIKHARLARDIARAAGIRVGSGLALDQGAKLYGSFADINDFEGSLGYVGEYPASVEEFKFPDESERMARLGDLRFMAEARILANVTSVGVADSSLLFAVEDGAGVRGFVGAPPEVPLDSIGLHVSGWRAFAWNATEFGERPVITRWLVSNPSGSAGSFSVGLAQVQVRA